MERRSRNTLIIIIIIMGTFNYTYYTVAHKCNMQQVLAIYRHISRFFWWVKFTQLCKLIHTCGKGAVGESDATLFGLLV